MPQPALPSTDRTSQPVPRLQHRDPQLLMHRAQRVGAELARLARRRRQRAEPTVKLRGHLEAWGRILCPEADGWGSHLDAKG